MAKEMTKATLGMTPEVIATISFCFCMPTHTIFHVFFFFFIRMYLKNKQTKVDYKDPFHDPLLH